jgi:hypothetical protein
MPGAGAVARLSTVLWRIRGWLGSRFAAANLQRGSRRARAVKFMQREQIETEEIDICATRNSTMLKKIAAIEAVNKSFIREQCASGRTGILSAKVHSKWCIGLQRRASNRQLQSVNDSTTHGKI